MTPIPRRLRDALAQSEAGSALLHRHAASRRAAAAIESECRRIVPAFQATRSGGCEVRGSTLRLNVEQPVQVAKLRQAVPRLLLLLQQQGFDVIEIKIGVQPRALTSSVRRLPNAAAADAAAAELQHGPGSSQIRNALDFARKLVLTLPESQVRAAAQRLASNLSARLARTRDSGEARNK